MGKKSELRGFGGYQSISPTILFAHINCNIAVGGAGIVSGMAPKGGFDTVSAEELIEKTRHFKSNPPGKGYPEYADYPGIGGKLYRQGMIKMIEFVTLCSRDRLPRIIKG